MKLLICKDNKSNTLLESRNLNETDSIKYLVIEDAPEIERREGYTGHYELDSNGQIIVTYEKTGLTAKERLIKESKEKLAKWLEDNPLTSKIHNAKGETYTVTQEKQAQLTQMLFKATTARINNEAFTCRWNAEGKECEDWTYEELKELSDEIYEYVYPRVSKQQAYEVAVNECQTDEDALAIQIEY